MHLVFFLIYLFVPVSNSLDFNDALNKGQFERLHPGKYNSTINKKSKNFNKRAKAPANEKNFNDAHKLTFQDCRWTTGI